MINLKNRIRVVLLVFLVLFVCLGMFWVGSVFKIFNLEKTITFEAKIPKNTPQSDTVHIYFPDNKSYEMNKKSDYVYSITLPPEALSITENNTINYRYGRNGHNFNTAEYIEPDTNDYFWRSKGRTIEYKGGKIQKDLVKR